MAKILIVDDDEPLRNAIAAVLRCELYEPIEADSVLEAMASLRLNSDIEVVISDIVMPDKDGIEFTRWLAQERPGVPVIVMSGSTFSKAYLDAAELLGACKQLAKPFSAEALLRAVKECIDGLRS